MECSLAEKEFSTQGGDIFNLQMFGKSVLKKVYSKSRNRCLFGDSYLSKNT